MKTFTFIQVNCIILARILIVLIIPLSAFAQPANDLCSNAVPLSSGASCTNTGGSLRNGSAAATATAGINAFCGDAASPDVWYSFVAQTAYPTIRLSSMGSNMRNAPRLQIFRTTSCLVADLNANSTACVIETNSATLNLMAATTPGGTGLTVGATYLVRVFTGGNSAAAGSASSWNFNICITDPTPASTDYGKSYINITKGINGGTVDPGDELEIRATLVVRSGTIDSLAYFDTLRNTKGLALVPNQLAFRTNEGMVYSSFGDNLADGDAAWRKQIGVADTAIQFNMGPTANSAAKGKLSNRSRPNLFNNLACIIMVTYRVQVYAGYGTKINFGGGAFSFRDSATGVSSVINFPLDSLIVYKSPGLCQDAVSVSNIVGAEFNGTFGTASGVPNLRNRGTSAFVPGYTYAPFSRTSAPNDYYYGIASNTSQEFTVINTWAKPDPDPDGGAGPMVSHRIFNLWDISGDHTGAANQIKGNPPCDSTQPVSASNPCGYMLVINASYKTDYAFNYTATNLCPNTFYELSAWVKNICSKCGCDSTGKSATTTGYIPSGVGDSSGVNPNLAFKINGTDYYTTGNIPYTGTATSGMDPNNVWIKKGFTYMTGPSETSFNLTIRNNAPGGGGNDWALDDIAVATCLPYMRYSPSLNPTICGNAAVNIADTVRSFYDNYVYYKWQRSTNNGGSWTDVTGPQGPATLTDIGSEYEYVTNYTVPPANTNLSDSGDIYRLITATTLSNLSSAACQVTDGVSQISLSIINCGTVLKTELLSFSGRLIDEHANFSWSTSTEETAVRYEIERSLDQTNFIKIGTVDGYNNKADLNEYSFVDPSVFTGKAFYRVALTNSTGKRKYSRTIQLTRETVSNFAVTNIVNPFNQVLNFNVIAGTGAEVEAELLSIFGKIVRRGSYKIQSGLSTLSLTSNESLPAGTYILRIKVDDRIISKKVLKTNIY